MDSTPRSTTPERSLNRQLVLEEDEYTAALSHIIARDFFPSLVHLDATNGYLDALQSRDPHLINASMRRLEQISDTPARSSHRRAPYQTPSQTPYGERPYETPLRPGNGEPPTKKARYDAELSLDQFQARYTSEDNSSFTKILDEENRQRKEKWSWAWEAQKRVEEQKNRMIEARERMLIEPAPATGVREKFVIEAPSAAGLITDGKNDKKEMEEVDEAKSDEDKEDEKGKQVVLKRSGEGDVDVMAPKKDTRPAGVDGWKFKARNSLMFPPDADASPYHEKPKIDTIPKGEERSIQHGSTRLPEQDDSTSHSQSLSAPPSPTRSRIDAAIQGTPYRPHSPTTHNFSLVPNVPSPTPSELGPAAVKQLMTWGTLNATPRIISQSDDPAESIMHPPSTPFHLPTPSSREVLSHRLSHKAAKSLRARAGLLGLGLGDTPGRTPGGKKGDMGPPSWTPKRSEAAGNLTPAAKRLLNRTTMGTIAARRAEAMERAAGWDGSKVKEKDMSKVRWTPTPSSTAR
ncbi:aspartate aminotransferase [Moniliophthora roreri MCA 2997]|uniref:Aspartate aminotransferase n=1 Tax=Moniliophthora roreri (strain MCA 2997) TaxID=1381753 RepID=V2XZN9_MONRO|nr:aspartate aminotransferase [Moniliophthora roreri MCA 2997]